MSIDPSSLCWTLVCSGSGAERLQLSEFWSTSPCLRVSLACLSAPPSSSAPSTSIPSPSPVSSVQACTDLSETLRLRDLPGGSVVRESTCQAGGRGFDDPWSERSPGGKWHPSVFLPGESRGQTGITGYSSCSCRDSQTRLGNSQ